MGNTYRAGQPGSQLLKIWIRRGWKGVREGEKECDKEGKKGWMNGGVRYSHRDVEVDGRWGVDKGELRVKGLSPLLSLCCVSSSQGPSVTQASSSPDRL